MPVYSDIMNTDDIRNIKDIKEKGTAVALGMFDGVHLAHRVIINSALSYKEKGLIPAVFTFSTANERPERKKLHMNILTDRAKTALLEELGVSVIFSPGFEAVKDMPPEYFFTEILIKLLNSKAICCGYDYLFGKDAAGDVSLLKRLCSEHGISLDIIPVMLDRNEPVSSSSIREHIKAGEIEAAAELLGYKYYYELPVIKGEQIGRTLGIPTANQNFDEMMVIPRHGVYASEAEIENSNIVYKSVTNIGIKPTDGTANNPLSETHIIDFNRDIYGKLLKVRLLHYMRPEKKMGSMNELKTEILKDIENRLKIN